MNSAIRLRPSVLKAKETLAQGREKLRQQHDQGSPGVQVCTRLTDLFDQIVLDLFEAALVDLGEDGPKGLASQIALVPHGGYGRRDVAPYSDVDLMILHHPKAYARAAELARRMVQDMSDVGLVLGHSLRTPSQAISLGLSDATIFTSLTENRYLTGSVSLFRSLADQLRSRACRRFRSLFHGIILARQGERIQYGDAVYLLEPNLKRSRGGLRGIQMVRWLGFARCGEVEIDSLSLLGLLSDRDRQILRNARNFFLQIRNEMHFHGGKSTDQLDRGEQLRLADRYGYVGTKGMLPVEQFMQQYFLHSSGVRSVVSNFIETIRPRSILSRSLAPLMTHRVDRDIYVGPSVISTSKRWKEEKSGQISEILRLMDLANLYDRWIDHPTWESVRLRMQTIGEIQLDDEGRKRFLSIMSQPPRLGELLGRLNELGVLEKIIPGMAHAKGLLQFNQYHKYTVDVHCIGTVRCATRYQDRDDALGEAYRSLRSKRILHLALLIHDLGKGFEEDHSDVGARYALGTAAKLELTSREAESLRYLVQNHLVMSHLAFRRDTTDKELVVRFAIDVGSPELLKMLFVLTCADFDGVGPGVLNDWKVRVLAELYRAAMGHLGVEVEGESSSRTRNKRQRLEQLAQKQEDHVWFQRQLEALPPSYLKETPVDQIIEELSQLRTLPEQDAFVSTNYLEDRDVIEITVGTHEEAAPGVFHRIAGAVTSLRMSILSAEINTLARGLVLDRFFVVDQESNGEPADERMEDLAAKIKKMVLDKNDAPPNFRARWTSRASRTAAHVQVLPTQVKIDNDTSEIYTIIEIFAHNQLGLLYTISRTIYQLGLNVAIAKIATHLDQVVDVFYVADDEGRKIEDEGRLQEIIARLGEAVDEFSAQRD
ncbi:[protein-PII] uridylyltransferase [Blastopirellula retiformator]|uniref:Bifunctional uridylyltransferase/uridylyl-removing enzyme n=1 Tax=Blastopirellula retiformator TaxID=2527970 RepID=A0A5C5VMM0_9BACT|nr:[protein-PII] uridylyltransferase [Blastopirellula retiformator]TWT39283.1 Bifunctional uridylyltransferase/uridylyl-removing enzyme [Blastopirellula retiformator]